MKVHQLIEALRAMPQDADIVTHASNHSSRVDDTMVVGLAKDNCKREVVVVGNWIWVGRHHAPIGRVFMTNGYGDDAGKMLERVVRHVPEQRVPRTTYERREERWELVEP